jgi:hypothetical protein
MAGLHGRARRQEQNENVFSCRCAAAELVKTSFIFFLTPRPATQKDHDEGGGGRNGFNDEAETENDRI